MASRKFSPNQISRLARVAVNKYSGVGAPVEERNSSTEPTSAFVAYVERQAFRPRRTKRSLVYHTLGEAFPYLQTLASEVDFGFANAAQIAALYVSARTRAADWHLLAEESDALDFVPSEALVEHVNAYFSSAGAPLRDEMHEMHQMCVRFLPRKSALPPAEALQRALIGSSLVDALPTELRVPSLTTAAKTANNDSVCKTIMRDFAIAPRAQK